MGLDQYAFTAEKSEEFPDADSITRSFKKPGGSEEIAYWRKHPDLHGWMENLWRSRIDIPDEDIEWDVFNIVPLGLTAQDLDSLEEMLNNKKLPYTKGFFFGKSQPEYEDYDREFIAAAREALSQGYLVYYYSWW